MSQRDEIHRKALRAALAVTGRAHTGLAPALGAALVTAACSAPQPTPDTATDSNQPAEAASSTNAATSTDSSIAPAPASCASDSGVVDRDCCFAYDMKPDGCTPCGESTAEKPCLTCRTADAQFGDPECCSEFYQKGSMEDAMAAGCTPWGPPAPPAWTGLTLDELLPLNEAA